MLEQRGLPTPHNLVVSAKKSKYIVDLYCKFNFLRGESGIGKTKLMDLINYYSIYDNSSVNIDFEQKVVSLDNKSAEDALRVIGGSADTLFIADEDSPLLIEFQNKSFSEKGNILKIMEDADNCNYLFIGRDVQISSTIPLPQESILTIEYEQIANKHVYRSKVLYSYLT